MVSRSVEEEIRNLYALSRGEFVKARDDLARRLNADGRRDEAVSVKARRRPTVGAWALNQLVRRHPPEVDELLRAGEELRKAQRRALSGVSGGGLREASERRRKAIRALVQLAQATLDEAGHGSGGTIDAIQASLEAASTVEEAARELRAGRLVKELPPPAGFGSIEGLALVPAPPESAAKFSAASKRGRPKGSQDLGARDDRSERARAAEFRAELGRARAGARELQRAAEKARKEAARAGQAAVRAQEESEHAQRTAEEARRRARDLAAAARQAGSESARAEREAARASRAAEEAEARLKATRA